MDEANNRQPQVSCWRKNGVWGTEFPRCEKLKYVNHCRNCDVFEAAAIEAFASARKEIENSLADDSAFADIEQQSHLPFRLSTYCFSVPTNAVLTISEQVALHSIPFNTNAVIRGLVAINHEVFPLLDIQKLLALDFNENMDKLKSLRKLYQRILVVTLGKQEVAFYVDEVYQVHRFAENSVQDIVSHQKLNELSRGTLKDKGDWCDDCLLLDLDKLSEKWEQSTHGSR